MSKKKKKTLSSWLTTSKVCSHETQNKVINTKSLLTLVIQARTCGPLEADTLPCIWKRI